MSLLDWALGCAIAGLVLAIVATALLIAEQNAEEEEAAMVAVRDER